MGGSGSKEPEPVVTTTTTTTTTTTATRRPTTTEIHTKFILQSISQETHHNMCFDVGQRNICYFMVNDSRTDWESAWTTCRNMNASLPVIQNTQIQRVLENYLRQNVSDSCVWTAGRYIADNQWRWINGKPIRNEGLLQNISLDTRRGVNAILNRDFQYEARYSTDLNDYICQFSGVNCNSSNSIFWKGDCLVQSSNRLNYKQASRACIQDGGDLATFAEDGDLQRVSVQLNRSKNYWIGLRHNLLIWNASGLIENIKPNLMNSNCWGESCCLLLLVPQYWLQLNSCNNKKRFVCQTEYFTENTHPTTEKDDSVFEYTYPTTGKDDSAIENTHQMTGKDDYVFAFTGIFIGGVVGGVFLLFFLLSVIIIVGRNTRNNSTKADPRLDTDKTYESLQNSRVVNGQVIFGDNGIYATLVPTQIRRDVNHDEDPLF